MSDVLHAIEISVSILIFVFALITGIVALTVNRAAVAMHGPEVREVQKESQNIASLTRRSWLSWMVLAWTALTASVATGTAATVRFMYPNVLFEPPTTFKAGLPSEIRVGEVDTRFKESNGVWLVYDVDPVTGAEGIAALSDICTHLGCIPNWLEDAQEFKCPCHGSGYYKNGINFEGPTPRPLERFAISLADDGQIQIDKSRKFQYEKGEWASPQSFLKV